MKYWYFKGADVAGPLSVAEIVNDEDFSADTFVCPEDKSADSEAWKPADQYMEDFGYFLDPANYPNPPAQEEKAAPAQKEDLNAPAQAAEAPAAETDLMRETPPEENLSGSSARAKTSVFAEAEPAAEPSEQPEKGDLRPESAEKIPSGPEASAEESSPAEYNVYSDRVNPADLPPVDETSPELTIHARSPLNAAMDDNLLDEIPASAVLSSEEEAAIEEVLSEPSSEEKGAEEEIVFNEASAFLKEKNSAPKQVFEEHKTAEPAAPVLATESEKAPAPAELQPDPVLKSGKNPGRQILEEARSRQAAIVAPEPEEEEIFPPENVEEREESLDTFTASSPVMRIEPEEEPRLKLKEASDPEENPSEPAPAETEASKPESPAEDKNSPEAKPAEEPHTENKQKEDDEDTEELKPIFTGGEVLRSREEEILSVDDEKEYGEPEINHGVLASGHEADAALLSVQESVNSQFVKAAPTTTGNIISSSDGRVQNPKNKRNDLIYVMVMFMFVLIVVALMMMFTSEKNKEAESAGKREAHASQTAPSAALAMDEPVARSVIQGIDEGLPSPEARPERETQKPQPQAEETAASEAQNPARFCENLIKNYPLADGETIERRFGKIYDGAYQTKWSCAVLHGDRYIGEFFASKVRSEPIRYMFSVDVKSGEINGLNNAAIELLIKK